MHLLHVVHIIHMNIKCNIRIFGHIAFIFNYPCVGRQIACLHTSSRNTFITSFAFSRNSQITSQVMQQDQHLQFLNHQ